MAAGTHPVGDQFPAAYKIQCEQDGHVCMPCMSAAARSEQQWIALDGFLQRFMRHDDECVAV